MKKLFFIFTIATLALVACSKDDDKGFAYDKELVYGTWEIVELEGEPWPLETTTATFNRDGTYVGVGALGNGEGTYKLSGKTITTYVDGEKYLWYTIVSLSAEECTLIVSDGEDSYEITCEKW